MTNYDVLESKWRQSQQILSELLDKFGPSYVLLQFSAVAYERANRMRVADNAGRAAEWSKLANQLSYLYAETREI